MAGNVNPPQSTDFGSCTPAADFCEGPDFSPGAMALLVDKLLTNVWGYSPHNTNAMRFVPKWNLTQLTKQVELKALPGKKKGYDTSRFFKNACALARYTLELEAALSCKAMAVLFRDSDRTGSSAGDIWNQNWSSIADGFVAAGFYRGVPMVPNPKSEVWLLCAVQHQPYQSCYRFETISGNDDSPNSAKEQLDQALDARGKTKHDVNDLIDSGAISPFEMNMPSFNSFRDRLEHVAASMIGGE